jgi:hypothetical protein
LGVGVNVGLGVLSVSDDGLVDDSVGTKVDADD